MKIIQIAPNTVPVPPWGYGGKERQIYFLTEELTKRGHEVILYAKKGSACQGEILEYPSNKPKKQLDFILQTLPADTDIIHDHYGIVSRIVQPYPIIRSVHGDKKVTAQVPVYVSKTLLKTAGKNKGYFVHNGIRLEDYRYRAFKDDFLLFIGRMAEIKGVHIAIDAAKRSGRRLFIAGPIRKKSELEYFNQKVQPELNHQIIYLGNVGGEKKLELLARAYCVLFPSIWNEPFGLVPIEALASGTPVLALKYGAVPEILKGLPQLLCKNEANMSKKIMKGEFPSPQECRLYVETHFSVQVMTDNFLRLYTKIIKKGRGK